MGLAVLAFIRLWYVTHSPERQAERPGASRPTAGDKVTTGVTPRPPRGDAAGAQACRTLDRALEAVVRAPADPSAQARAREQLEACASLPPRACELGVALDARAPLGAGESPLRGLLETLCQRCPAASNPCAGRVILGVMELGGGRATDLASLRWHLEHAGPGTAPACAEVTRLLLVPAALSTQELAAEQREVLGQLAPLCVKAGQLPLGVLHAAVVQGQVPGLAALATGVPPAEAAGVKPERLLGVAAGGHAFDGQEATGVELAPGPQGERWEKEGALSAVFDPPLKQLTGLRVRVSGPGALRAIVRTEEEVGLSDPRTGTSFVHPTACRFLGTRQWEECALAVPLLDVEALAVFPEKEFTLSEVEARGVR
jgi:hypothetical protein